MRFFEVVEAAKSASAEKQRRAREQLATADRKRASAARKYQDELRASRLATQQAKAKMRALSLGETGPSEVPKLQDLLERPRSYPLRDRGGTILGWIEPVGRLLQAKDRNGSILGWYDPRTNQTRDKKGSIVGDGDFLSALVVTRGRL